jgi:membrane associated rhomboid family serine protease
VAFGFVLIVIAAFALYVSTPDERRRLAAGALAHGRQGARLAVALRASAAPYRAVLRGRTPYAFTVPLIAAAGVVVFLKMAFGQTSMSDPNTLVAWGASVGPRTTAGEWWRLATMVVVHASLLHMLVSTIALVQAGMLLERLLGSLAVGLVYLVSGLASGLVQLASAPMEVSTGPGGAIAGLYGLLLVSWGWTALHRSELTIPWRVMALTAPGAALFLLYHLSTDWMGARSLSTGFGVGVVCGLALGYKASIRKPALRTCAAAFGAAVVALAAFAFPLRGIADPRLPLERLVAAEDRTAALYTDAVKKFTRGRVKAVALADLIEGTVVPELETAGAPVKSLSRVPREYQPAMSAADQYLRLRLDGWRQRAAALRGGSMGGLRAADQVERTSLDALQPVRMAVKGG